MKEELESFIKHRTPIVGLAAWAARMDDRSVIHECLAPWIDSKQVEQAVTRIHVAAEAMSYHRIQPKRLCWAFEKLRLYVALRSDGFSLTFFVENRSGQTFEAAEKVLDEFVHGDPESWLNAPARA